MSRMVRKQVYITGEQEKLLKRRAKALGVTQAELVRRGVDLANQAATRLSRDPQAWEEAKQVIEERLRLKVAQTGRGWTREELYDERLERFSRRQ